MNTIQKTEKISRIWPIIVVMSMWIITSIIQWEIVDKLTPLIQLPLQVLCFITACVLLLICIYKTILHIMVHGVSRGVIIRFLIVIVSIIIFFIPFDEIYEEARFAKLSDSFDSAAEKVLETDCADTLVKLDKKDRRLSRGGGEVFVSGEGINRIVIFYKFRGILGGSTTYVYVPTSEAYDYMLENEGYEQITPIRDNWYYCLT